MQSLSMEWAEVSPGLVVVATAERSWMYQPGTWNEFASPMEGPGTPETTRRLLEISLAAGRAAVPPRPNPQFTVSFWAWCLCGAYVTTHETPPLLREAADRFRRAGREPIARWAEQRAQEEAGHDELALLDLRALGIDAEQAVRRVPPPGGSVAQAALFRRYVHTEDPVECVGFAIAIERVLAGIGEGHLRFIQSKLPPGVDATRCQRVHSGVGADVQHLAETIRMVSALAATERSRIARAVFETAKVIFSPEPLPDEQTLQGYFRPLGLNLA